MEADLQEKKETTATRHILIRLLLLLLVPALTFCYFFYYQIPQTTRGQRVYCDPGLGVALLMLLEIAIWVAAILIEALILQLRRKKRLSKINLAMGGIVLALFLLFLQRAGF